VSISVDSYAGWQNWCATMGCSMTAVAQVFGEIMASWVEAGAGPDAMGSDVIARARLIDSYRGRKRRRGARKPRTLTT